MALFLNAKFLGELLAGSYETQVQRVAEAVSQRRDLFGEGSEVIGTFGAHALVLNEHTGQAWRVQYESSLLGIVQLGTPQQFEIPSQTGAQMAAATKDTADSVVSALMAGKTQDFVGGMRNLLQIRMAGVPLTLASVAAEVEAFLGSDFPWVRDLNQAREAILVFLGSAAENPDLPSPRFGDISTSVSDDDTVLAAASAAMQKLVDFLANILERLTKAQQVNIDWTIKDAAGVPMPVPEFVEFVDGLSEDVEEMAGYAQDALNAADTDPQGVARIYDALALMVPDIWLATAFAEKLAPSFTKAG